MRQTALISLWLVGGSLLLSVELTDALQSKGCCSVDVLVEAALEDEAPVLVLAEVAEGL